MSVSCSELLFIGKMTLILVKVDFGMSEAGGGADGPELVEGLSSGQLFLEDGPSSSLSSYTSPKGLPLNPIGQRF